jgi:NADH-quinone oxidoreductase subunit D
MEEIIERKPFEVSIGPQHPALKEPGNFQFTVDGESINAAVRLGYAHQALKSR